MDTKLICEDCECVLSGSYKLSGKCPDCGSTRLKEYISKIKSKNLAEYARQKEAEKTHDQKFKEFLVKKLLARKEEE